MSDDERYPVGAVETTVRVIETLEDRGTTGVTEIAEATGVSKGTVHKHLTTLRSLGYVVKEGRQYRVGTRFLAIGSRTRERSDLYHAAVPAIDNLADTTGAVVNLMIPEHGHGVYLYRAGDTPGVEGYLPSVGGRVHLHATAGGKAILSRYDRDAVEAVIDRHGLPALTEKTITAESELRGELRSIRDRGLAFERGEHLPSVQCVAAPVTADGQAVGAVSVSGSIDEMSGKKLEEDLAGLVLSTANEIELVLFRR